MFQKHPRIETPNDCVILWRYMDFWKFLNLLNTEELHLSRVDRFEDKYEGRALINDIEKVPSKHPVKVVDEFSLNNLRKKTYISCWTACEHENYALWKIYTDNRTAIAIKTNTKRLIESLSSESKIQEVGYVRYKENNGKYRFEGNTNQLFFEKWNYYKFEEEVRIKSDLVDQTYSEDYIYPNELMVKVNLIKLIEAIYIAPLADEHFINLIKALLTKAKLDIPVIKSNIKI